MKTKILQTLAVGLVLHGFSATLEASSVVQVPEISPASISAGLAILAGGVLMLRARRRK